MKTKHIAGLLTLLLTTLPLGAQPFNIASPPTPLSVQAGEVASFRMVVTGAVVVAYSWFKDSSPLTGTDRVSGVTSAQLNICPVVAGDAGQYRVRVTDGTNILTSADVLLAVNTVLPVFTNAPVSLHVTNGSDAVFSASATGTLSIAYGWQRDGIALTNGGRGSGIGTATLAFTNVSDEDTGWYSLTASNVAGVRSSEPARLTVHTPSELSTAANFDAGIWTTANWQVQSAQSHDGIEALQSAAIGDNGITFIETTVYGPGDLSFYWNVWSEAGYDSLGFKVNGAELANISDHPGWSQQSFHLGSGAHVLRWEYRKDQSKSVGADAGWVDEVAFTPTRCVSLETALNAIPLPLITYGNDRWFGQENTNHDGSSAARCGYITDNQSSTVETTVSGPGWISFHWKVSSEYADPLMFMVDGVPWESIANEVDWTNRTFHIPWGRHTLSWRYQKDYNDNTGARNNAAWLDQVNYTPVGLFDLTQAADWPVTPWTSSGSAPWFGQNEYSADGADALQSSPIADSQTTFVDTTVTGPGTLIFKWKISSEYADPLQFLVDSNAWNSIAGEVDWNSVTNVIRPGPHLLRWQYSKDYRISQGLDAGWVDQVGFVAAPPLPMAVNAPALDWNTSGDAPWFPEMVTTHDGVASVRSGDITHNQASVLQTTLNGPVTGSFLWKVSSEETDPLIFLIDGIEVARISGEVNWTPQTFSIPVGSHTLTWRYQKDHSLSAGRDVAWLDQFSLTGFAGYAPQISGHTFTLTVPSVADQSYILEYKNDLSDPAWTPLSSVPGTGLSLDLSDPAATNSQRFYRVRMP